MSDVPGANEVCLVSRKKKRQVALSLRGTSVHRRSPNTPAHDLVDIAAELL